MQKESMMKEEKTGTVRISVTKETISRLVRDVKEIITNPLSDHCIYYSHDEEDMLKGYALIVGPEDTPYFGGYYLFVLNYPPNYPHAPPVVTYCTNNGSIRFNPNLYVTGKVCISILNTWRGEQWTACQTISTILLSLSTLLCKSPLLNEPGCRAGHPDERNYEQIIEFANVDVAMCDIVRSHPSAKFDVFRDVIMEQFFKNYDKTLAMLDERCLSHKDAPFVVSTAIYGMRVVINYHNLRKKLENSYYTFSSFKK